MRRPSAILASLTRALVVIAFLGLACVPVAASAALVDQRGLGFALGELPGPVVLTFVATRCTDACPIANAVFSAAVAKAARARLRATFVTATLDPSYDTPFVMAQFARQFEADPRRWLFVSGARSDVRAFMHRFGVASKGDEHSSFIYVIDGRVVRTLLLSSDAPDRIVDLLKESVKHA